MKKFLKHCLLLTVIGLPGCGAQPVGAATAKPLAVLDGKGGVIFSVAFSPDGHTLASNSMKGANL